MGDGWRFATGHRRPIWLGKTGRQIARVEVGSGGAIGRRVIGRPADLRRAIPWSLILDKNILGANIRISRRVDGRPRAGNLADATVVQVLGEMIGELVLPRIVARNGRPELRQIAKIGCAIGRQIRWAGQVWDDFVLDRDVHDAGI